jgi:hypothetical protein
MNSFYEHHKDSINWHYHRFDRIFLNGLIQQPERVVGFFSTIAPSPRPDRSFTPTYPTTLGRKPTRQPLQSNLNKPEPAAKSP